MSACPGSSFAIFPRAGRARWWLLVAALPWGCSREEVPEHSPSEAVSIRVQVLRDQAGPLWVSAEGAVRISTLPDLVLRFEGSLAERAPLEAEGEGFRLAGQFYPSPIRIASPTRRPIHVKAGAESPGSPAAARSYRGSLDLLNMAGKVRAINQVSLEDYLVSVVGGEMPASFPPASLESQAIASRTYAVYHLLQNSKRSLDKAFDATQAFQVYQGVTSENSIARRAVRSTTGWVLTYRGKIFPAYFHSTCGGNTTNASLVFGDEEIPPLRGVPCDGCAHFSTYRWNLVLPLRQVEELLKRWAEENRVAMGDLESLKGIEPLPGGYLRYVKVVHSGGSFEVRADIFKGIHSRGGISGFRSTSFEVEAGAEAGMLEFRGSGFGHGVGMCQCGAAWKGRSAAYGEILAGYYPDSELKKIY